MGGLFLTKAKEYKKSRSFNNNFLNKCFPNKYPKLIFLCTAIRILIHKNVFNSQAAGKNGLFLHFQGTSFMIWIFLRNINDNFRNFSWKIITMIFVNWRVILIRDNERFGPKYRDMNFLKFSKTFLW